MLPIASQIVSHPMRRTLSVLGITGLFVLALVTLRWATNSQVAGTGGARDARAADPAPNDRPGAVAGARNTRAATEFLPRPSQEEERILSALAMPVEVEFLDVPLEDCLNFIGEYPNLPKFTIYVDRVTLTDEGVALDQPITLKLKGLRLESVLNLLLRRVQLDFLVEDDVLKITTSAKAGEIMFTRTYPVGDLYHGRPDAQEKPAQKVGVGGFGGVIGGGQPAPTAQLAAYQGLGPGGQPPAQNDKNKSPTGDKEKPTNSGQGMPIPRKVFTDLVEALTTTIEPDSWDELSGPGSYTYVSETRSLVVRQTWQIHRQILQLLRDLREAKALPAGEAK